MKIQGIGQIVQPSYGFFCPSPANLIPMFWLIPSKQNMQQKQYTIQTRLKIVLLVNLSYSLCCKKDINK